MRLYIFTPTYNRGKYLEKLYTSLCNQTNKDFIWLIVDDGSTDDTRKRVVSYKEDKVLTIQYLRKENGGKHTAYNLALGMMKKEGYHICVDSDDYLSAKAVEYFHQGIHLLENELKSAEYVGVVYPRTSMSKKNQWLKKDIHKVHIPDILFLHHLSIETTILISNQAIKGFRFKVFPNEKFLSEETLYYDLAEKGFFYPSDAEVCYTKYLEHGLTRNLFELWQKNYEGTLYSLEERFNYIQNNYTGIKGWLGKVKTLMNIQALRLTKHSFATLVLKEKNGWLLPFSYIWKCFRFRQDGEKE